MHSQVTVGHLKSCTDLRKKATNLWVHTCFFGETFNCLECASEQQATKKVYSLWLHLCTLPTLTLTLILKHQSIKSSLSIKCDHIYNYNDI